MSDLTSNIHINIFKCLRKSWKGKKVSNCLTYEYLGSGKILLWQQPFPCLLISFRYAKFSKCHFRAQPVACYGRRQNLILSMRWFNYSIQLTFQKHIFDRVAAWWQERTTIRKKVKKSINFQYLCLVHRLVIVFLLKLCEKKDALKLVMVLKSVS